MAGKPPHLSEEELTGWLRELSGLVEQKSPAKRKEEATRPPAAFTAFTAKPANVTQKLEPGDYRHVNAVIMRKIKRGQYPIDKLLDLHGMTRSQAREALQQTIIHAAAQNERLVLVITGQGEKGRGTLRQSLPEWVNDEQVRPLILAYDQARREDGGHGAWYILLKRIKDG